MDLQRFPRKLEIKRQLEEVSYDLPDDEMEELVQYLQDRKQLIDRNLVRRRYLHQRNNIAVALRLL